MYVYFATQSNGTGEQIVKIGYTKNIKQRVKMLKYSAYHNPCKGDWRLLGYCEIGELDDEVKIQGLFSHKQTGRDETFTLTDEEIKEVLSKTNYVFISPKDEGNND